ncbi:MAG: toll/interleukin-1 receptor domain-containing protein [Opitutaceae bacterium]|nr:toll/interleukin-1 receptor domain-containing protein [Opitutaceae bacterium]
MSSDNLVLISHCSADADPAKLLAETLELKGYKTQCKTEYTTETKDFISECLLFIPVVSKNAESNKLGSFRIAWKVAAKKIDNLEAAATFILPVIVDDTSHYKEIVPKPFRTLPWLRVNTEEVSTEFVEMAIQMLGAQAKDIEFPPIAGGQSLPPSHSLKVRPHPHPRRRLLQCPHP